jgi:predicted nucleic acid-binding protein
VAIKPLFLIDTSAYARMGYESVRNRVAPLLHAGIVASCAALEAEALYSARSPEEYDKLRAQRAAILTYLDTEERDWRQALAVQGELAARSQLRGCGIQDLLIAVMK